MTNASFGMLILFESLYDILFNEDCLSQEFPPFAFIQHLLIKIIIKMPICKSD